MYKIFKYPVWEDNGISHVVIPENHKVIRLEYVDDGFYKGWFVWAIVDPHDTTMISTLIRKNFKLPTTEAQYITPKPKYMQIGLLEEQTVYIPSNCLITNVSFIEGKCYLFYEEYTLSKGTYTGYSLKGRKTGQELGFDPEEYNCVGWLKPWIKQELCVYMFAKEL
jgi:hypothetical protein